MKGLLLKDFYMIIRYCKSYIIIVVIFLAASLYGEDNTFFLVYPIIMVGMLPMTLLSYDERDRWDKYSAVLPYTRSQIVSAKYMIGLIGVVAVGLLTSAALAVSMISSGEFSLGEYADVCGIIWSMGLAAPMIVLPFVFKLGVEKGRLAYYFCIGIICAACTGFFIGTELSILGDLKFASGAIFIIMAALYAASWRLSIAFYKKREL